MSDTQFQNMKKLACLLPSSDPLKKWQLVWSQCQRTKLALEMRLEAALRIQQPPGLPNLKPSEEGESRLASPDKRSPLAKTPNMASLPEKPNQAKWPGGNTMDTCNGAGGGVLQTACSHSCRLAVDTPQPSCPLCHGGAPLEVPEEAPSSEQLFCRRRLRKARSVDRPGSEEPRTWAEPSCCSSTGVWIKGLEVSSLESVGVAWEGQQPLGSAASSAFHPQEDQRQSGLVLETRSWSRWVWAALPQSWQLVSVWLPMGVQSSR